MAGIYIHIPFCKKACHYCDFHFSTQVKTKAALVEALVKEIELRHTFLENQVIDTIYFGGGTPSLLDNAELNLILGEIHKRFNVSPDCEVTLEANPDDLTVTNFAVWKAEGINRLSIGVQSFYDTHLAWMNRSHTSAQAIEGIKGAQDSGIDNISADLIFGFAQLSDEQWQSNIKQMLGLGIPHISAYMLTVETHTVLNHYVKKGQYIPPDDALISAQFLTLHHQLEANGYNHYEISNYGKPRQHSKHNSSYWAGQPYLGIGPSAHSYNGKERMWNIANNARYMESINQNTLPLTIEILSTKDKINEALMTGLRKKEGVSLTKMESTFGKEIAENVLTNAQEFIEKNWLTHTNNILAPTLQGYLMADHIASELFVTDEILHLEN